MPPVGGQGRLRAPPVADTASNKEWQRSKFEAAVSAARKFRVPQQKSSAPTVEVRFMAVGRDDPGAPHRTIDNAPYRLLFFRRHAGSACPTDASRRCILIRLRSRQIKLGDRIGAVRRKGDEGRAPLVRQLRDAGIGDIVDGL